jgi:GntR family transcriptional regulator
VQATTPPGPDEPSRESIGGPPALRAYRLLVQTLREGRKPVGSRLPAERVLARQLGINRATLRLALGALAESGRVEAAPSSGWYVRDTPLSEGPNGFVSFTAAARERGLVASARILVQRVRSATLEEADALGLPPTAPILDLERLRRLDGVPICVSYDRLPVARVAALVDVDLTDRSLTVELAQRCALVATRCDYEVEAAPSEERLAGLLEVEVGSPLLVSHEVLHDQRGATISLGLTAYRGDAFRFRATLATQPPSSVRP